MRRLAAIGAILAATACGKRSQPGVIDAPVGDGRVVADGAVATCTPTGGTQIAVEDIAAGLTSPVLVTAPAGDARMFVLEQPGRIRIIENGTVLPTPFLELGEDIGGPVVSIGDEQGLLGLAFDPDYAHDGRFYVNYTRRNDDPDFVYANVIAEFTVSSDPDVADPTTERDLLVVPKRHQQHNAGTLGFGPDGYLWISLGDGGSQGDPDANGQDTSTLLGSMLRIDVASRTGSKAYGIPPTNPFASSPDGPTDPRPEIFAYGFRNPYRWDFDRATGDLIIADVGQDEHEEIDIVPPGQGAGANFGWKLYEGTSCYAPPCPGPTGFFQPAVTHTHTGEGFCAIIGGAVYRGSCFPDLVGTYFYTDYCEAQLHAFTLSSDQAVDDHVVPVTGFPDAPTSLHADATGELYVTSRNGTISHIVVAP
jgi:glucose/arabinose dehydrogenase